MADPFLACIPVILAAEGGFVNDPRDPGGATNRGVTLRTLASWRHHACTIADVRALAEDEARAIYRALYWNPVRGDDLPAGVNLMVFDFAVNAGPARSARMLQRIVGAEPDGAIGPATLGSVRAAAPEAIISKLARARLDYYEALPTFSAFGRGWAARVADVQARALRMAAST